MSERELSMPLRDIEFLLSDGRPTSLSAYAGNVLLIVNVASKCPLTTQYYALEEIYEKYHYRKFNILAFPSNDFGAQEPGSDSEIQFFCRVNFSVLFPVFKKIVVKGEGQHPLYQRLTSELPKSTKIIDGALEKTLSHNGLLSKNPADVMWNFEKFLLNRSGLPVKRFAPDIAPGDRVLVKAIEEELALT